MKNPTQPKPHDFESGTGILGLLKNTDILGMPKNTGILKMLKTTAILKLLKTTGILGLLKNTDLKQPALAGQSLHPHLWGVLTIAERFQPALAGLLESLQHFFSGPIPSVKTHPGATQIQ